MIGLKLHIRQELITTLPTGSHNVPPDLRLENRSDESKSQSGSVFIHSQKGSGGVEGRREERLASPVYSTSGTSLGRAELLEHGPPRSLICVYQQRGAPGGC